MSLKIIAPDWVTYIHTCIRALIIIDLLPDSLDDVLYDVSPGEVQDEVHETYAQQSHEILLESLCDVLEDAIRDIMSVDVPDTYFTNNIGNYEMFQNVFVDVPDTNITCSFDYEFLFQDSTPNMSRSILDYDYILYQSGAF